MKVQPTIVRKTARVT